MIDNHNKNTDIKTMLQFESWHSKENIINNIIAWGGYSSYLEIGLWRGDNFSRIKCEKKVSVDPAHGAQEEAVADFKMTSDEFFLRNKDLFDVIFIDGLHHADQVLRDIQNSLKALSPGGIVICHDLNPCDEAMQIIPRSQLVWTGDCWAAWVQMRILRPDLPVVVIDADYGVGLILPKYFPNTPLDRIDLDLTWENFNEFRRVWLNLEAPEQVGRMFEHQRKF